MALMKAGWVASGLVAALPLAGGPAPPSAVYNTHTAGRCESGIAGHSDAVPSGRVEEASGGKATCVPVLLEGRLRMSCDRVRPDGPDCQVVRGAEHCIRKAAEQGGDGKSALDR